MAIKDDIEALFKTYYSRMHHLASAILHDTEAAHDIVHDVFVSLLDSSVLPTSIASYLLTSVRNRCFNCLKAIEIQERFRNLYLNDFDESDDFCDWPDEETLLIISKCESQLSPTCLEIFRLRYRQGLSVKEISIESGIGERMIYKHLSHALKILKKISNGQS